MKTEYTEADVFLNAEDSKIIAPYIDIPNNWEWWYPTFAHIPIPQKMNPLALPNRIVINGNPVYIPALTSGLLEVYLQLVFVKNLEIYDNHNTVYLQGDEDERFKNVQLQNRRDAMMFLIKNNLIKPREADNATK